MTRLDWALWLLDNTPFYLFPLRPDQAGDPGIGKRPMYAGGCHMATRDREALSAEFTRNPFANIGVAYWMSGHCLVELDVKDAINNGVDSWKLLCAEHGLPPDTLTFRSWSGGVHMIYAGIIRNSAGRLGPGIDTRGEGGYGVGPGSEIGGKAYEVLTLAPIAELPAWVVELYGSPGTDYERPEAGPYDEAWAVEYATMEVENGSGAWGEPPRHGSRDNQCYHRARRLNELGVPREAAVELLTAWAWTGDMPDERSIENYIDHVYNDERWQQEFGTALPPRRDDSSAFQEAADALPRLWRTVRQTKDLPSIGFYDRNRMLPNYATGGVGTVFGLSGAGKSSVVLLWAMELAEQGVRVAYLCGEGDATVATQMRALEHVHSFPDFEDDVLRVYTAPMINTLGWQQTKDSLKEFQAQVVLVDTLATITAGMKEYDQVGALYTRHGHLGILAGDLEALVLAIDHTGYAGQHERGDSAKGDNADVRIAITANIDVSAMEGTPTHINVHARKVKGARPGHHVYYAFQEDRIEGIAVPVRCTHAEWTWHLKEKGRSAYETACNLEHLRGVLIAEQATGRDAAMNTITLVHAVLPKKEEMSEGEYEKMCRRVVDRLEQRSLELAAIYHVHDGVICWYV